jgi:hypothetical protein
LIGDLKSQLETYFQEQNALLEQWIHSTKHGETHSSPADALNIAAKMVTSSQEFSRLGLDMIETLNGREQFSADDLEALIQQFNTMLKNNALDTLKTSAHIDAQLHSSFLKAMQKSALATQNHPWYQATETAWQALFPGFKPTDWFSKSQEAMTLTEAYQQALSNYAEQYDNITQIAIQHFKSAIEGSDTPIDSLKKLHDLWVTSFEKAHSDHFSNDDYQKAYAEVTHTYLDLTKFTKNLMNEKFEQFGLCTHSGMSSLYERHHTTRKELAVVKRALSEQQDINTALQASISALEQKIADITAVSIDAK